MHLVSAEQAERRVIDSDKVCDAIAALKDPASIQFAAQQFALLGDPTRLRVLVAINAAGPISVSSLTVATGLTDDQVLQSLRLLRAGNTVAAERNGRVNRYRIVTEDIAGLVTRMFLRV